jgi:hypothetical protein
MNSIAKPLLVLPSATGRYRILTEAGSTFDVDTVEGTISSPTTGDRALTRVTNCVVGEQSYIQFVDPYRPTGHGWLLTAVIMSISEL